MKQTQLHAINFDLDLWTPSKIRRYMKKHKYVALKRVDKTSTQYKFRLAEPIVGKRYFTIALPNGINLVFQYLNIGGGAKVSKKVEFSEDKIITSPKLNKVLGDVVYKKKKPVKLQPQPPKKEKPDSSIRYLPIVRKYK